MALTYSDIQALGTPAPGFSLTGTDGRTYSLESFQDAQILVVVFMCNHCPYVIAVQGRINALTQEYHDRGVRLVAINSNDFRRYPDDSFAEMKKRSIQEEYVFPYLLDPSQDVARAYHAACTPDFFVYRRESGRLLLRYQGRLDDSWKDPAQVKKRDLADGLDRLLIGDLAQADQKPSMGCSIKWISMTL